MEEELKLERVLEDPKGGTLTIRVFYANKTRGGYWSFIHSGLEDDELKTSGTSFKEDHFDVVSGWLERNGMYHIRDLTLKLIEKMIPPAPSPPKPKTLWENY